MKRWVRLGMMVGGALVVRHLMHLRHPANLRDQVVVITGASSGIGRAAAHTFAALGARVVLVARRIERLEEIAAELAAYGRPALPVQADVRVEADLTALVERVLAEYGRIDVLVNNAGVGAGGPLVDYPPSLLSKVVETNLIGPMRLTQLILPIMQQQGTGHIVLVNSASAKVLIPGFTVYVAAKAGLLAFAEVLRRELKDSSIMVSTVFPAMTRTPMTDVVSETNVRAMGMRFDPPEVPALAIVNAVRYRWQEVTLAGPVEWLAIVAQRYAPALVDWAFRNMINPRQWLK